MKEKWILFCVSLVAFAFFNFTNSVMAQDDLNVMRHPEKYIKEVGSKTFAYTNVPSLNEYYRTYRPHGLSFQSAWLVAYLIDETGQRYNLFRKFETASTALTAHSKQIPGVDAKSEPIFKPCEMYLGRTLNEIDEKNGFILVKPFHPGSQTFSIVIRPQHIHWKDADGRIDLEFKAIGPALEFYVPGKLEDAKYRSEPMSIKGTVDGNSVTGFGVFDYSWGPVGIGFVQGKIYKFLEKSWAVFFNVYEDDSLECGIFVHGIDEFNAFYFNKNGEARILHDNEFSITWTPDKFLKNAKYKTGGREFEFVTEARQAKVETTLVYWAEGRMVNLAESREPVKTFGVIEFFRGDQK